MGIAAQCLHGAKVCVVPNPDNEYRPLVLRHRPLAFISGLLVTAKVLSLGLIALLPVPAELSTITTARIVQLTNQERASAGLGELKVNEALSKSALAKAQDMLEHDYFAHISPTGVTPWFWIKNEGYGYRLAGENLAIDFFEAEDVVAAWMASPSHRDNLLHPDYVETGVGVLTGEFEGSNSTVVVHMFGLPSGEIQQAAAAPVPLEATGAEPEVAAPGPVLPAPQVTFSNGPVVNNEVDIQVQAQTGTTAVLFLNNQERKRAAVGPDGSSLFSLSIADLADGEIVARALVEDDAGRRSDLSAPQIVQKDTTGPEIEGGKVAFIAAPQTDRPRALVLAEISGAVELEVRADERQVYSAVDGRPVVDLEAAPVRLAALDENGNASVLAQTALLPAFITEANNDYLKPPARISRSVRTGALSIAVVVAFLLSLAVVIKIRIQKPGMIMHAVFVLVLALTLLTI